MTYEEILRIEDDARRDAHMAEQFDHYGFMDCLEGFDADPIEEFLRVSPFDRSYSIQWWKEALEEYKDQCGDDEEENAIRRHIAMMEKNA